MKYQRRRKVLGEVRGVMAAGVDAKFMRNLTRSQTFIESNRANFKAEVILVSAIEINMQAR